MCASRRSPAVAGCLVQTTRANALQAHFQSLGHDVMIINHESLNLSRSAMYASSESEKKGRATLKSTLERFLSAKKLIIFDYLNAIKGYRYEMWCRAREVQTQHCTIYCNTPIDQCAEWNKARPEGERYSDSVFVDLCQRMETPNEEKRWDQPLFTLDGPDAELPLEAITDTLLKGKIPSINQAVIPQKMEDSNYLFELDRITQEIVRAIVERQADASVMVGDVLKVPHTGNTVTLVRKIHLPELRRIQTQYLKLARIRTPDNAAGIATSFVDHLNVCLKQAQ